MHATARTDLAEHLAALPALAGVGASVHWRRAPLNSATPVVVLNVISDLRGNTHGGADGLAESLVQVDAYAADYYAVESLRAAVLDELNGFRGVIGTTVFDAILHDASRDDEPEPADGPRASCDLRVHYRPA
jgi:hypothetical protein